MDPLQQTLEVHSIEAKKELLKQLEDASGHYSHEVDPEIWDKLEIYEKDRDVMLTLMKADIDYMEFSKRFAYFMDDRSFIAETVLADNFSLLSDHWKDDDEIATLAVKHDCFMLQWVSERLRDSERLVELAVTSNGLVLKYASRRLQSRKRVAIIAVSQVGDALEFVHEGLRNQIALEACMKHPASLRFVPNLTCNRVFMLQMVTHNGKALEFASRSLQADLELVTTALAQSLSAFEFIKDEALMSEDIVKAVVTYDGNLIRFAPEILRGNRAIGHLAVKSSGYALRYLSAELRNDDEIVQSAMKNHPAAYYSASERIKAQLQFDEPMIMEMQEDQKRAKRNNDE